MTTFLFPCLKPIEVDTVPENKLKQLQLFLYFNLVFKLNIYTIINNGLKLGI